MNSEEKNTLQSIHDLQSENLYEMLVQQIIKDFRFANVEISFSENVSPDNLVLELFQIIKNLLLKDYNAYLNLLYRIDVSEKELKNATFKDNIEEFCKHVCFLILKKEIQKIYYRKKYQ
ncbi:hypothetical protein [Aureivirga marina]|uniref:hypothetical protein n=1 Tax=Aureivirga marina TaxID=1182451 RepID=UPI0018CB2837|nr:hypothetical protein [Aureivirga marina]